MIMNKCPKCGGTDIDRGKMICAGDCAYQSDRHRIVFKSNCRAYVCFGCGYIETYVDREYLDKLKK